MSGPVRSPGSTNPVPDRPRRQPARWRDTKEPRVTDADYDEERPPPVAGARVIYLGPVAPHWEIECTFGDTQAVDGLRARSMARLALLPPHDPQFRRNRERVVRDAERENIELEWDLGIPEE